MIINGKYKKHFHSCQEKKTFLKLAIPLPLNRILAVQVNKLGEKKVK